jgi:hypothetical protein
VKFKNLAWGSFVFAQLTRNDYASPYQNMSTDKSFLNQLRTNPSKQDFQRLRDFLTHYGVPWAPTDLAEQYMSVWSNLKPHVQKLANETIEVCSLGKEEIETAVAAAYSSLQWPAVWGGDTVASKSLHFFNINLFMMWDSDIQSSYGKSFGPLGYVEFLREMQQHAHEAIADFKRLKLPGTPEEFLSEQLGYNGGRPFTKFLDDYNWVTITKHWPVEPPDWIFKL